MNIDRKIKPLVDILNAIPGVKTISSCEGHFWRSNRPYVYFHCSTAQAKALAVKLHDLNMTAELRFWWQLTGIFNADHQLCFVLDAPAFSQDGMFKKFLRHVVFRKRIDADLGALSAAIKGLFDDGVDNGREEAGLECTVKQSQHQRGKDQIDDHVPPLPLRNLTKRVWIAAIRASSLNAWRHFVPAMFTRKKGCHGRLPHSFEYALNLSRLFLAVVAITFTLAACGGNRELQKDGSGTDEMLKSPCACLPVPYTPPAFEWVG